MTNIDKAIAILEKTNDGDDLAPKHLKLVELAVNNGMSELGQQEFNKVFEAVEAGTYTA